MVNYVCTDLGYRYACVVAVGRSSLGWSMVHHSADSDWKQITVMSLPIYQKAIKWMSKQQVYEKLSKLPAFQHFLNQFGFIKVPRFNRKVGLELAVFKAFEGQVEVTSDPEDVSKVVLAGSLPKDPAVLNTLMILAERAQRINWERKPVQ